MKKFLLMCVVAAALTGCAEYEKDRYYVGCAPVCGAPCASCHQTVSYSSCISCARPAPQPKTIVVMVPPAPQPVVEHEIVYQPQPSCGCPKCGCHKAK